MGAEVPPQGGPSHRPASPQEEVVLALAPEAAAVAEWPWEGRLPSPRAEGRGPSPWGVPEPRLPPRPTSFEELSSTTRRAVR